MNKPTPSTSHAILEAICLALLVMLPLYFNPYSYRMFESAAKHFGSDLLAVVLTASVKVLFRRYIWENKLNSVQSII